MNEIAHALEVVNYDRLQKRNIGKGNKRSK